MAGEGQNANTGRWLGGYDHFIKAFKNKSLEELQAAVRKVDAGLNRVVHTNRRAYIFGVGKKIAILELLEQRKMQAYEASIEQTHL